MYSNDKLTKELYELSEWAGTENWNIPLNQPRYSLGYLLRKLPANIYETDEGIVAKWDLVGRVGYLELEKRNDVQYFYTYDDNKGHTILNATADTPEDAACKLAIELFKQGILTPSSQETK